MGLISKKGEGVVLRVLAGKGQNLSVGRPLQHCRRSVAFEPPFVGGDAGAVFRGQTPSIAPNQNRGAWSRRQSRV